MFDTRIEKQKQAANFLNFIDDTAVMLFDKTYVELNEEQRADTLSVVEALHGDIN